MKVLLVNMSDSKGGAAIVAHRLLGALNKQPGVEAKMLVADRQTNDKNVVVLPRTWWLRKAFDRMAIWAANHFSRKGLWLTDGGFFGTDITRRPEFREADVIHLHWVNQGFLSLNDIRRVLRSGKRVVWTMHDSWACVALCHHAGECTAYKNTGCVQCPQLPAGRASQTGGWLANRFTKRAWERKKAMYAEANVHLIPCSSWMAEHARQSLLTSHLPITIIPNSFELSDEAPVPCLPPTDKKRVCFSAARIDMEIKGFDDFLAALQHLRQRSDIEVVLVGGINNRSLLDRIPFPCHYIGYRRDMMNVYASVDCLVSCSRYETLPTTIVEAQAVGTTPVAYRHSGAVDLIEEGVTGYFARYRDAESLAQAIERAIDSPLPSATLRQHVERNYNADVIARRHLQVYEGRL